MDENRIKNRYSNIELLRIVAMMMIVIYHISFHCVRYQITDKALIDQMANGLFCYPMFYNRLFLVEGVMPFGATGNGIFVLISGYFLVEKEKTNLWRLSKKILFQISFVAVILVILSTVFNVFMATSVETEISLRTINDINFMNWFAGYYFLIVVIGSLFLNKYLQKADKQRYQTILIVSLCLVTLAWSGGILEGLATGLRNLMCGLFLYALGGFIKRFNPFAILRSWALIALLLFIWILIYLSYYNSVETSVHHYLLNAAIQEAKGNNVDSFIQPIPTFENFYLITIITSVTIFELFSRINLSNIKFVNFIGGGTFIVYLLHDNELCRKIWLEQDWVSVLSSNPVQYVFDLLKWTGLIFAIGILLYLLYLGLGKFGLCIKKLAFKQCYRENGIKRIEQPNDGESDIIT